MILLGQTGDFGQSTALSVGPRRFLHVPFSQLSTDQIAPQFERQSISRTCEAMTEYLVIVLRESSIFKYVYSMKDAISDARVHQPIELVTKQKARAVIMATGQQLTPEDLELASPYAKYERGKLREAREGLEKDMVQRALARHRGNITQSAVELGISRPTLYELMDKLGIPRESKSRRKER